MADLSITAANVALVSGQTLPTTAGATITAGQAVYLDASALDSAGQGKAKLADANASSLTAVVRGIALHAALAGQPLLIQITGDITIGGTVVVGTIYVVSGTAGAIAPSTDLVSGWYTGIIGIGISATVIRLGINNGGVAVP